MTKLHKEIIKLKEQGYSYAQIKNELKCSKGTISYYLGKGQKEKHRKRQKKHRSENSLQWKIYAFRSYSRQQGSKKDDVYRTIRKNLMIKIKQYLSITGTKKMCDEKFSVEELLDKIGNEPKCYLTGRPIDLANSSSYQLDHKMPRTRGGDNSLDNCGLACTDANQAKHNLTVDEFKQLCLDVIRHAGIEPATSSL